MFSNFGAPQRIVLDNGLTLIHQYRPGNNIVAIDAWIKAGAIVEPDEWSGMAHFLEHMLFKGSKRLLPGVFDQAIEGHGGIANAATSYDYAHYHMVVARQHFATTLPYLAEILVHAAIPDTTFDPERQVVFEEMRQCWDNPDYVAFQQLGELLYTPHGYCRPILGTPETLQSFSPNIMRQFHRAFYQPPNMTIVIVGEVECDTAINLIQQCFSDFAPPTTPPVYRPAACRVIQQHQRQELQLPRLEEARLILSWLTPGWGDNAQKALRLGYCFDLLSVVLASGRTSRLVQELLETRGLVYGIDASFSLQRDSGLFSITVWLPEAELGAVEAILHDRMAELIQQPITSVELQRYQRFLCNEAAYSTELSEQLAAIYGYYDLVGQLSAAWEYSNNIMSLHPAEIQAAATAYLQFDQSTTTIVRPDQAARK